MAVAIPHHDEDRWGSPITDDGQQVVRLADLLRAAKGPRPWRAAVIQDLGRLASAGLLSWFYLRCGESARPIADSDVWRGGKASGAELLKELEDLQARGINVEDAFNTHLSGMRRQDYFFTRDELAARGVPGLVKGDEPGVGYKNRKAFEKVPGVAGLCGASGLLTYAAEQWAELQRGDQLDDEPAVSLGDRPWLSSVALLRDDVERLFAMAPAAPALEAANSGGSTPSEPHSGRAWGGSWPRVKGSRWTLREREEMFRMRHIDKVSGEQIAKIVGVSRQSVEEQIGGFVLTKEKLGALPWSPTDQLLSECGLHHLVGTAKG